MTGHEVNIKNRRHSRMIEINKLRVIKKGRTICTVCELVIAPGERVAILGANGSGKTTLMRVLCGLETNFNGHCTVNTSWQNCVYVHQSPYLFRGTVLFNVTYGLRVRGMGRDECESLALQWLKRLGLYNLAKSRVTHLSGGEQRRVALARAMILRPHLLLLDEPLADMDATGAAAVSAALDELRESTILVASPATFPQGLTQRVCQLESIGERSN